MTSISNNAQLAQAPAMVRTASPAPAEDERGILVKDPHGTRTALRWVGGLMAGAGVVAAAAAGVMAMRGSGALQSLGGLKVMLPSAAGAAVLGAGTIGMSFVDGLQPKYKPILAGGFPDLETAQARAVEQGDDVGIFRQQSGSYGLVDYAEHDFDHERIDNLRLEEQQIPWEGLVSRDGDFLQATGRDQFTNVGRAHPDPTAAETVAVAGAGALTGGGIGTDYSHQPATLGKVVGDPAGYASRGEAAQAAFDATGDTAIAKLGSRYVLMDARLPEGVEPRDIDARGAALTPVTALQLQHENKLYQASAPGDSYGFVGRSTPYQPGEPLGQSIAGRAVDGHVASAANHDGMINSLRGDTQLVDAVFNGSRGGATIIRSTDPDGKVGFHEYTLGLGAGRGSWDTELGAVDATLLRQGYSDRKYYHHAPYGIDSRFAISQAYVQRIDQQRTTAELTGVGALRDTGWRVTSDERDYGQTREYQRNLLNELEAREQAEAERIAREAADREARNHPPGNGPGDDYGSGSGNGPGDEVGSGSSSGNGPGDEVGSGSGSAGGNGSGDEVGSGSGSGSGSDTGPVNPTEEDF